MQMYESRLSYFNDKARINYCKPPSVYKHGGPSRPRQNCHSCIFETKENSNLRICIQYLGHHSKTTCQKSAKSMRYRVRPKFEFYRKSLLTSLCKNSTRYLYGIFSRPCFKSRIKRSLFFGQVALFSQTITHVMFCSLCSISPRYSDKNGKIVWRLSSKLNGCLTQIENSKWWCHF